MSEEKEITVNKDFLEDLIKLPSEIVKQIFIDLDDTRKRLLLYVSLYKEKDENNTVIRCDVTDITLTLLSIKNLFDNMIPFKLLQNGTIKYWINYVKQDIVIIKTNKDYKLFLEYRKKHNCIELGYRWDYYTEHVSYVPYGLTDLILEKNFNEEIKKGDLPNSLTHLYFNIFYNKPFALGVLPNSLTHLYLSISYNKPFVPGALPESLIYLKFPILSQFNQQIKPKDLPINLEYLEFNGLFNQKLEPGVLPKNLKYLKLSSLVYEQKLEPGVLPENLTNLYLYYNNKLEPGILPENLKCLGLSMFSGWRLEPGVLPENLKKLYLISNTKLEPGILPENLKCLELSPYSVQKLKPGVLPKGCKIIRFDKKKINKNIFDNDYNILN